MNTSSVVTIIRQIVEEACQSKTNIFGYGVWTHHIVYVVEYGKLLAYELGADPEIVEVAALLHDYANIKNGGAGENHHIEGAEEADKILHALAYPVDKIDTVKNCIMSHRGSVHVERTTPEALCLASADAMAHIDQVPSLLYLVFSQYRMDIDQGTAWVSEKLQRSWNKLCPEAKAMMQPKYESALLVLGPVRKSTHTQALQRLPAAPHPCIVMTPSLSQL